MDILLKLKDCNLIKIGSEMDTDTRMDYYGDITYATQFIYFTFDDGVEYCLYIDDEENCDFCSIANFFYNKDFAEYSKQYFIGEFCKELCARILHTRNVKTTR